MANVLSLALRVTADASGLRLDPVQRALVGLGDQAEKLTSQFAKFSGGSEAAAAAQARFEQQSQDLINTLRDGGPGAATQFAAAFERLTEAANKEAAAFQRAQQITEANLTTLERFDRAQAELTEQLNAGRISLETYNRATENAAKGLTDAERAARGLAVQQKEIDTAAESTTLKFNELSGVFSVLPGPLGNIAGRISGIASASEGLSRIFAGGLTAGFQGLVSSVTALINPFTLALAGITAFAAGATAVVRGLVALEDRVERLSRLATQLGVSFEFVQVLEEAGRRADVSIEQLSGSFARLQNTLAGADEESKKAQAALQRLGVSVQDFGALSEQQRIDLIGERLAAIEDPAQRSAAAIALFGRSGVQLLPFFNELGLAATDMERFGRAVSDLDRERLADFGGSIDTLSLATEGLGTSLLLPFVGLGDGIARGLAEVTAGITAIVDPIGRILEPLLTQIGRIIELIGVNIGNFGRTIGAVFEPFAVIVQEVSQALEPLYEGIFNFLQGISNAAVSVTEWVVSFTPIGAIAANVGALGETISRVVTIITTAFQRAGEFVGGLVSRFSELVAQSPFLQTLGDIISSTFGAVASVFSTIANAIGGVVGRLLTIAEKFLGIDRSAQQASKATQNLGSDIEELTEEERKAAGEREKFLQGFTDNVSKAIDESAKFGQAGFDAALQYQNAITDLQERLDRGLINEEVFRREAAAAEAAYSDQIAIAEQAAARIEENTRRVDGLLAKANEIPQIEQDLNAIESEIARVQTDLAAARENGATEQANALAGRLAQLDQLQAGLQEQADQAAQGFEQGFDAAFASVDRGLSSLVDKAGEFGNEGAIAAQQLADGIAAAQEQVKDGILNREAFEAEVERQKELFEDRLADLRQLEQINNRIAEGEGKIRDRQFEIELARAEELATVRTGSVEINDIRSGGISAFFDTLKEDPAIAEAKKQTAELEKMRRELAKLNAEKVDILAGTG
jgi:phage-related protein